MLEAKWITSWEQGSVAATGVSKMEKLPRAVQINICKYLSGADIANLLEAMPNMKHVLSSLAVKGTLRQSTREIEWVDAKLFRLLHSTLSMTEAETELEATTLCKAMQYYQEDCRSRANSRHLESPRSNKLIHLLAIGCHMLDWHLQQPLIKTLREWKLRYGTHASENCEQRGGFVQAVAHVSNFDIHFYIDHSRVEVHDPPRAPETTPLHAFDGVMYMNVHAVHSQVRRRLWQNLRGLMAGITKMASNVTVRSPTLLILDIESEQTGVATSRCGDFERLLNNVHRHVDSVFRANEESAASADACKWWRVWRIHQRHGMFVNMYEALQWVALQVAIKDGEKSSQERCEQRGDAPAHSSAGT